MTLKDEIKAKIIQSGWSMSELVQALNEKYNRNDSIANLSNKLTRGTIKYKEVEEIAEILGCSIEWIPMKHFPTPKITNLGKVVSKVKKGIGETK